MPQIIVTGADVLANPTTSTNSSGGQNGQGTVTILGGSAPFEPDDIIVFEVENSNAQDELQDNAGLSDITVYENMADFMAGIVKFDYRP